MSRHASAVCLLLAAPAAMIAGCGGGSGSGPVDDGPPAQPAPPTAAGDPIVYLADQDTAGTPELYLVDAAAPGVTQKINAPLVDGGTIFSFGLSADLQHVVYTAFQDSANDLELYVVDLDDPGTSTRLNAPVTNGDVQYFQQSPDGSQVAYAASVDGTTRLDLYLADIAAPGVAMKLGSELPAGGNGAAAIAFSPDGQAIVYAADQDVDDQFELLLVELAAPGDAIRISGTMTPGGSIHPFAAGIGPFSDGFGFSPDGTTVVYIADQDIDELYELYAVDASFPGMSRKLSGSLPANGDVRRFAVSPDSNHAAYVADQDADERLELYLVNLAAPGVSMKINPSLPAGREVSLRNWSFSPDGDFIVYLADHDTDDVTELYRVETAAPGVAIKVNGPLGAEGRVHETIFDAPTVRVSPNGTHISYIARQSLDGLDDVYNVEFSTPGVATKLNPPMTPFGGAWFLETTSDSLQVFYVAEQENDFIELYRVDISAPGVSTTINGSLAPGGEVRKFLIKPGLLPD